MARIAVDVDSTLYDFETVARDAFTKLAYDKGDKELMRGAYAPWVEWRSPPDACGPDIWVEAIRLAHDPKIIAAQIPYTGAPETINALVQQGHSILYLTNRAVEAQDATESWLTKNGFPVVKHRSDLICTTEAKGPLMNDCRYIIDDRPKTLVEFVYSHIWHKDHPGEERLGFAIHHEYNRSLTDVSKIYLAKTWGGLNYYLVGKGLLDDLAYKSLGVT